MKLLRQTIRKMLLEDRHARRKSFVRDLLKNPNYNDNWADTADDDVGSSDEDVLLGYHGRAFQGRIMKKAFSEYADRDFLESLELIHWTNDKSKLVDLLQNPSVRDELSATAYLPGEKAGKGSFGQYGLVIDGYVTLLANDMDDLMTGYSHLYKKANPERVKSSGANKGIGVVDDQGIVLSKVDWAPNPFLGNEALVDNWKILGIVVPDKDYDELVDIALDEYENLGEILIYKASTL